MQIAYMAVAMRDPNPVHVEEEVAAKAGMPSVIAHGTFPQAYAGALLSRTFGVDAVERFALRLTSPVFPGDRLRAEAVVRERDQDGTLVLDLRVVKVGDGAVAGKGEARVRP
jgi:acyl dehydratase